MRSRKEERHAVPTDRYKNLSQAVDVFLKDMNIGYEHAKGIKQLGEFNG